MRRVHRGEKGFTLLELLIVIAILGILAAVVVPNIGGFIGAGNIAASNTEAANVRTAAMAYYADNNANWPADSDALTPGYLSAAPDGTYTFDANGMIATGTAGAGITNGLTFTAATQQWGN
jgi:prepilin-type N-terminal cleavage/methylation domain-containing protein